MAPPGELWVKAGVVLAGKTVWSTPERLRGEVLTTRRYTNPSPLPLRRCTFICECSNTVTIILLCGVVQYLADIEEHLGVTIDQVDTSLKVTASEFDGKVTYGQKRSNTGTLTLFTIKTLSTYAWWGICKMAAFSTRYRHRIALHWFNTAVAMYTVNHKKICHFFWL